MAMRRLPDTRVHSQKISCDMKRVKATEFEDARKLTFRIGVSRGLQIKMVLLSHYFCPESMGCIFRATCTCQIFALMINMSLSVQD